LTGETLPVDPGFLDALRRGLPPCAGAALGVDRLVMLLLGKNDIADGMYR
jgi:elongation factor P--(R)-beta-lysine ligase